MKTLILLTAIVDNCVTTETVAELKNFVGIMNIDKQYQCTEMPGVVCNNILTNEQKKSLRYYFEDVDCNIKLFFIEFNEEDDEKFDGTLQFKLDANE